MLSKHIVSFALVFLFLQACLQDQPDYTGIEGTTMGTTYHIKYGSDKNLKHSVDSLLEVINNSMSTYMENSTISNVNRADTGIELYIDDHFYKVFTVSEQIQRDSRGGFDPGIMPVLSYYGFGGSKSTREIIDPQEVDSLLNLTGIGSFSIKEIKERFYIIKHKSNAKLDFSAVAKGYGVDAVCRLLENKEILNYLVEIGGEVRCKGQNPNGKIWSIGINKPSEDPELAKQFQDTFLLNDMSMATSGNYRNFRIIDGKKMGHTIDPRTGYPAQSNLLSATVFAKDCITADAYATAFMVLGLQESLEVVENGSGLESYLIFVDAEGNLATYTTDGARKFQL